jgi:hypothetical protein
MFVSRLSRSFAALVVAAALLATPAAAKRRAQLPEPPAAEGAQIAQLFQQVTRDTPWKLVDSVRLQAETWHTEGMVKLGDRWVLSSVQVTEPTVKYPNGQIIEGTDRTPGAGFGHVMRFSADGSLLADRVLNEPGALEYHPGGLDYDGRGVWVTLAQYRPNSTSTFLRIDPLTLAPTPVLRAHDHFGGVVNDTARHKLVTLNWGSRAASTWRVRPRSWLDDFAQPLSIVRNPSHFVDYQDCKYLGQPRARTAALMLCSGITSYSGPAVPKLDLGGVALVDVRTMRPVHEIPVPLYTDQQQVATRNALDVRIVNGRLRLYLVADDNDSDLLVYEASNAPNG